MAPGESKPHYLSPSATLPEVSLRQDREGMSRLALTVIAHPCLERIGEIAWLDGEPDADGAEIPLSRQTPRFGPPRRPATRALEHRSLSRSPVLLRRRDDGGMAIDVRGTRRSMFVDGEALDGERELAPERLRAGLVILLSRQVVLFLHPVTPVALATEDDLGMIGESPGILEARNEVLAAARSGKAVLVRGATGTGKELVAQAVHRRARPNGRLVSVNLAAVPADLAASELFGKHAGAYTSAQRDQPGKIRQAHLGVLFLDEIGDAPLAVQISLLRVLDEGKVTPLGASRDVPVDFHLVTATDRDLESLVAQGTFRDALYHRLRHHVIRLPPLDARREDLGRLLVALLRREIASSEHDLCLPDDDTGADWLPAEMVAQLMLRSWPGNVRALGAVAEQIVVAVRQAAGHADPARIAERVERFLASEDRAALDLANALEVPPPPQITPPAVASFTPVPPTPTTTASPPRTAGPTIPDRAAQLASAPEVGGSPRKRQPAELCGKEIQQALARHGTMSAAARALGIGRASLYRRIERLGLTTAASLSEEVLRQKLTDASGDVGRMADELGVAKQGLIQRLGTLGLI